MRIAFTAASALLAAMLLLPACGGGSPATVASPAGATCAGVAGKHHAELVIQHGDGKVLDRCVGFDSEQVNGEELMKKSGVQYQTQSFSFGVAVCQIDREPAQFTQCLPAGAPYWALWLAQGGATWTMPPTGVSGLTVKQGDALGWRYTPAAEPSPAPPPSPHGVK